MKKNRDYNFGDYLKLFKGEIPSRDLPFEFFLNSELEEHISGEKFIPGDTAHNLSLRMKAWGIAGYDYLPLLATDMSFKDGEFEKKETISLNHPALITDWESFEKYEWPDPDRQGYALLEQAEKLLPEGMKLIVFGPDGVLENTINLLGFDNLCYLLYDDPELVSAVTEKIGDVFERYYSVCASADGVGALFSNDDWGFKTSLMISLADMKKFIVPRHKRITDAAKRHGKPVILHSCGMLDDAMDIIIDELGYDGKHSYEDVIRPVEDAYELIGSRIAVLGGMDVDYLVRADEKQIYERASAMLERTRGCGRYALGSGNSVPEYVPMSKYFAMMKALK